MPHLLVHQRLAPVRAAASCRTALFRNLEPAGVTDPGTRTILGAVHIDAGQLDGGAR